MKLLLDEHYSGEIARELRRLGHDVVAVVEHPELTGAADRVQFAAAPTEQRAIVTEDLADYRPLLAAAIEAGTANFGLVCVSPRRFPRNKPGFGRIVRALDVLLRTHPEVDAVADREVWLRDPDR